MDRGTEEALKAIITGLAVAQSEGGDVVEAIGSSLAKSASICVNSGDPFTAGELARLARWVGSKTKLPDDAEQLESVS